MLTRLLTLDRRRRHLLSLIPFLGKYKRQLIVGALMVMLTNVAAVCSPWILRNAIDQLYLEISREILLHYSLMLVVVSVTEGSFRYFMRRILISVSRDIEYDLRNDLFRHLQRLTLSFYQRNPTGDLMSKATNDLSAVRMVLGPGIMYSINTLFTSLFTVAILMTISVKLALLTLTPLLAVGYMVKHFGYHIHRRFEKIQEQFSVITTLAQENVSGIRVVKAYNQERAFIRRFRDANQDYVLRSLSLVRIWGLFSPLLTFLLGLSALALLWYGGRQVIQDHITLGDFVAFIAYLAMLTWPTIALGWVINIFERGSASMGRINQIFHAKPEIHIQNPQKATNLRGKVKVKNLSFSYNGQHVLRNISVEVQPGQTLAIVGNTGSGKSTLVSLLCHLYPVASGKIFFDGIDINNIPLDTLRKSIGYVPQDTFLFSETVAQNIAFGKPSATEDAIAEISKISNIWQDIEEFPEKFETFVGERGVTLSGGQKQRIAISRALLVDPNIIILDDALSSVDTHTEERILRRLAERIADCTTILISHRISTVQIADQILVLEKGRIVERGTHRELLQIGGYYADLYQKQLLREELEVE